MVPAMRSTALEVSSGMRVGGVDSFFSSVSWARAGSATTVRVTARVRTSASIRFIKRLLVSEDHGQELPSAVGHGRREERLGLGLLDHLPLVHEDDAVGDS